VRFASIGSGSEGNGLVVEAGDTRILIDCGFGAAGSLSTAEACARLREAKREVGIVAMVWQNRKCSFDRPLSSGPKRTATELAREIGISACANSLGFVRAGR